MSGFDNTSFTVRTTALATDTLTAQDYFVIYTNATAKTVTVPAISALTPGRVFAIINTAAGAITITPTGALINGAATFVTPAGTAAGAGRTWIANDGTNWFTVVGNTTS